MPIRTCLIQQTLTHHTVSRVHKTVSGFWPGEKFFLHQGQGIHGEGRNAQHCGELHRIYLHSSRHGCARIEAHPFYFWWTHANIFCFVYMRACESGETISHPLPPPTHTHARTHAKTKKFVASANLTASWRPRNFSPTSMASTHSFASVHWFLFCLKLSFRVFNDLLVPIFWSRHSQTCLHRSRSQVHPVQGEGQMSWWEKLQRGLPGPLPRARRPRRATRPQTRHVLPLLTICARGHSRHRAPLLFPGPEIFPHALSSSGVGVRSKEAPMARSRGLGTVLPLPWLSPTHSNGCTCVWSIISHVHACKERAIGWVSHTWYLNTRMHACMYVGEWTSDRETRFDGRDPENCQPTDRAVQENGFQSQSAAVALQNQGQNDGQNGGFDNRQ